MAPRCLLTERGLLRMLCDEADQNTSTSSSDFCANGLWQGLLQRAFLGNDCLVTGESSPESGSKGVDSVVVRVIHRKKKALLTTVVLHECPPQGDIQQLEARGLASARRIRAQEQLESVFVITAFGGCFRPWILGPASPSRLCPLDGFDRPPGDKDLYVAVTEPASYEKWGCAVSVIKKKPPAISKTPVPASAAGPAAHAEPSAQTMPDARPSSQPVQTAQPLAPAPAHDMPPRPAFAVFTSNGMSPAAAAPPPPPPPPPPLLNHHLLRGPMCSVCNINAPSPPVSSYFRAPVCMACAAHVGQFSVGYVNDNSGPLYSLLQQREAQEAEAAEAAEAAKAAKASSRSSSSSSSSNRAFGVILPPSNQQQPPAAQPVRAAAAAAAVPAAPQEQNQPGPPRPDKGKQPEGGDRPLPELPRVKLNVLHSSWGKTERVWFRGMRGEFIQCEPKEWTRQTYANGVTIWVFRMYVSETDPFRIS